MTNLLLFLMAFGGIALPVLVGLLTPGRKGSMRTVREVLVPGWTPEQCMGRCIERLNSEGFRPVRGNGPLHLVAERPATTIMGDPTATHTHRSKAIMAELQAEPISNGTMVRVTLWMTDWVIMDTGEGVHIDSVMARLLGEEEAAAPPVPNPSFNSTSALYSAVIAMLVSALAWVPAFTAKTAKAVAVAVAFEALIVLVLALFGIRDVRRRPGEMAGTGRAIASIPVALFAVLIAGVGALLNS